MDDSSHISEADALEIADDLFDNEIYGDNPDVVVFPHDFTSLTPDQLYELFVTDSKNNMGGCGRSVLIELAKEKHMFTSIPEVDTWDKDLGSVVAKKVGERKTQKALFVRICTEYGPEVYSRVQHHCPQFFLKKTQKAALKRKREEATEGKISLDASDSFAARVAHLVVESGPREILERIYSVQGGRASIDDKRLRVGQLWEDLASQFFNNPDWQLELFDSQMTGPCGAEFINPITVLQPHAQHSAKEIRQTFNNLKTIYTVVHVKFTASGNNEGGGDEFDDSIDSDDIFYENFAKSWYPNNARVLLYAHLLWKRSPPAFCMRTKTPGKQSQVGVKGTDVIPDLPAALSKRELSLSEFGDKIAGALKTIHTKSAAEIAAETEQMVKQSMCSDAQISRDNAMSRYYTAVALEQELKVANIRAKPKFTPESFDNVQHFLSFCRFNEQEVQAYSQQLAANGFTSVFSLGTLTPQLLSTMQFPLGAASSIMAVVSNMNLF